ncbi:MAG: hypothetical protein AB7U45_09400 [Desulfamplus sp.]
MLSGVIKFPFLSNYKALIQSNDYMTDSASEVRKKLELHFGKNHQAIAACDRLIHLAKMQKQPSLKKKN